STLHFPVAAAAPAPGIWIIGAPEFDHIPIIVLDCVITANDVRETQPHFAAWPQAEKFLRRIFHEIRPLDVKLSAKAHLPRAKLGTIWMVDGGYFLNHILGIIGQHDF